MWIRAIKNGNSYSTISALSLINSIQEMTYVCTFPYVGSDSNF